MHHSTAPALGVIARAPAFSHFEIGAEIFDQMQWLFDSTGFSDHQLHCVIHLDAELDEAALEAALMLTLHAIPILATRYRAEPAPAAWEGLPASELARAFVVTEDEAIFEAEKTYRIREEIGPQVRVCHLRGERSALAVTMNHMVADAAAFKEFLYFLCDTYSRLLEDAAYEPPSTMAGDRSIREVMRAFGSWQKAGAWLTQFRGTNRPGKLAFPFGPAEGNRPFIATRVIGRDDVARLRAHCRSLSATVNDVVLAAYHRALARRLGQAACEGLQVSIMIDMRRHLLGEKFEALTNLTSMALTRSRQRAGEPFEETFLEVKRRVDGLKRRWLGLGGFVKISLLRPLLGEQVSVQLMRRLISHPLLSMTNIGEIDPRRLSFAGPSVRSAFVCGSTKYKPYFQLALSGFDGTITLSSSLYGGPGDHDRIESFLREVEEELPT